MKSIVAVCIAFLISISFVASAGGSRLAQLEQDRIEDALKRMENSPHVFIRNGSEHTGKQAASHLRDKLKSAGKRIKTFDDFIEHIATKSSMSGKPYLVKMSDGSTAELAKWLREPPSTQPSK